MSFPGLMVAGSTWEGAVAVLSQPQTFGGGSWSEKEGGVLCCDSLGCWK